MHFASAVKYHRIAIHLRPNWNGGIFGYVIPVLNMVLKRESRGDAKAIIEPINCLKFS